MSVETSRVPRYFLFPERFGLGALETPTIAAGALTCTRSFVNPLPETSTADTVDSIVMVPAAKVAIFCSFTSRRRTPSPSMTPTSTSRRQRAPLPLVGPYCWFTTARSGRSFSLRPLATTSSDDYKERRLDGNR
jgi:hypothetical protein